MESKNEDNKREEDKEYSNQSDDPPKKLTTIKEEPQQMASNVNARSPENANEESQPRGVSETINSAIARPYLENYRIVKILGKCES